MIPTLHRVIFLTKDKNGQRRCLSCVLLACDPDDAVAKIGRNFNIIELQRVEGWTRDMFKHLGEPYDEQ